MLFIATALNEEAGIHASQTWTTLHSKNTPALSKQHLLKALAKLSCKLLSSKGKTFVPVVTPYLHHTGKTRTLQTAFYSIAT